MRSPRPLLLAAVLGAFPLACGDDGDAGATDTDAGETLEPLELGPCAKIVDCAAAVDSPVTRLIAEYGEDGMCWNEFPTEACWQDCRAILSDAACTATALCCECETPADCAYDPERPICLAGSCTAEVGGSDTDPDPTMGGAMFPATEYLVLLSLSVGPQTPLQLTGTVANENGMLSLDLQYLALDIGSDTAPRTPTEQPLTLETPVAEDGTFEFSVDNAFVPGSANPVTGSDIELSFSVVGQVGTDRICGALAGTVTVPANINLAGSTFSGIPVGDGELPAAAQATCD